MLHLNSTNIFARLLAVGLLSQLSAASRALAQSPIYNIGPDCNGFANSIAIDRGRIVTLNVGVMPNDISTHVYDLSSDGWTLAASLAPAPNVSALEYVSPQLELSGSWLALGLPGYGATPGIPPSTPPVAGVGAIYVRKLAADGTSQQDHWIHNPVDTQTNFGGFKLSGDKLVASASSLDSDTALNVGGVFIFEPTNGVWDVSHFVQSDPLAYGSMRNHFFGGALGLQEGELFVSSASAIAGSTISDASGAVHCFRLQGGEYVEVSLIERPGGSVPGVRFGATLAVEDNVLAVGESPMFGLPGLVHLYRRQHARARWNFSRTLYSILPAHPTNYLDDGFGRGINLSDGVLTITAPRTIIPDATVVGEGVVYQYNPDGHGNYRERPSGITWPPHDGNLKERTQVSGGFGVLANPGSSSGCNFIYEAGLQQDVSPTQSGWGGHLKLSIFDDYTTDSEGIVKGVALHGVEQGEGYVLFASLGLPTTGTSNNGVPYLQDPATMVARGLAQSDTGMELLFPGHSLSAWNRLTSSAGLNLYLHAVVFGAAGGAHWTDVVVIGL